MIKSVSIVVSTHALIALATAVDVVLSLRKNPKTLARAERRVIFVMSSKHVQSQSDETDEQSRKEKEKDAHTRESRLTVK